MKPTTYWILVISQRWHAWVKGSTRSVCGYVDAQFLDEHPALATIEGVNGLPPEKYVLACKVCRRKLGLYGIVDAAKDETVRAWDGFIHRHLTTVRARLGGGQSRMIAELLAEVGHPDNPVAQGVWDEVKGFLLVPVRVANNGRAFTVLPRVREVLAAMPKGTHVLEQVAAALRTWRTTVGMSTYGRYRADQVVEVMLQVPNVEAYVKHLKGRGLSHLAAVFHPNTLARAKQEASLRGVFAGSGTYWEGTRSQLNIVEE